MNDRFSLQRFVALFVRYWAEKNLVNGLYWLIAFLLLFWMFMDTQRSVLENKHMIDNIEIPLFLSIFPLFMAIQMIIVFSDLTKGKKMLFFMMMPALKIEKFLFLLIIGFVFPILFYFGSIFLIDNLTYHLFYPQSKLLFLDNSFMEDWYNGAYDFVVALFFCLIVFLGYFSFMRNQFLYTVALIGFGFCLGLNLLNSFLFHTFVDSRLSGGDVFGRLETYYASYQMQYDDGLLFDFYRYSIPIVVFFILGLVYAAFLKFSEKQIKV